MFVLHVHLVVGIGNTLSWQTPSMWPSQFPHVSLAYEFVFFVALDTILVYK
jgi:hypothetical protein